MKDEDEYDKVWPLPHQNIGGRTGWTRYNGGQKCDMDEGPCACGAWHSKNEKVVQLNPIWMGTFGEARGPDPRLDTWKELALVRGKIMRNQGAMRSTPRGMFNKERALVKQLQELGERA